MSLAFLLGAAKGASDRYVEQFDALQKANAERAKRRADNANSLREIKNSKDTLYVPSPEMQVFLDRNNQFGPSRFTNPVLFEEAVDGIRKTEQATGQYSEVVTLRNTAGETLNSLLKFDMRSVPRDNPKLAEELQQYEAALIGQLGQMLDDAKITDPTTGVVKSLTPIHNQIAGWDSFSPDKKRYINNFIDKAAGYTPGTGEVVGLTAPISDYTGYAVGDTFELDANFKIIPSTGERIHYNDLPQEAVAPLMSMAHSYSVYESQDRWLRRTAMNNQAREKNTGIAYGKSVDLQVNIHNHFVDGVLEENGGVISGSPSYELNLKNDLMPVMKKAGTAETIQLVADALPDSALYSEGDIPPGTVGNIQEVRTREYEKNILGIATADDRSKFNQRATTLEELADNAQQIISLIGQGAELGITGKAVAFIGAARSQLESFKRMFGDEIGNTSVFDNALASLEANMDTSVEGNRKAQIENATKIKDFLVRQLSYNIARSLESATGNARLSDIDVKKAEEALGLTGLLQNEAAAIKVLQLIESRARRDLDYHKAMSSRNLRKMQAGRFVRRMYGADSMISVDDENMSDIYSAGASFMRSIEEEALRTGIVSERGQIYAGEKPGRVAN